MTLSIEDLADEDGVILHPDLVCAGYPDRTIRELIASGSLVRLQRGRYALAAGLEFPADHYRALVLAALRADRRIVPTGPAALVLHGLPLLGGPPPVVTHARTFGSGRSATGPLRATGPLDPADLTTIRGHVVSSEARAVLDTARWLGVSAAVAAADAALRRRTLGVADLDGALGRMGPLWHVARARRARTLVSAESESPGESWSAVLMSDAGIPTPARQVEVRDSDCVVGRVDFAWLEQRVVGEFDGRVKYGRRNRSGRLPEDVLWQEKLREDRLRALGLTVVRWTTADLSAPAAWLRRLRAVLSPGISARRGPVLRSS